MAQKPPGSDPAAAATASTATAAAAVAAAVKPQSHRVYWQQRLSGSPSPVSSGNNNNNNNLITGSAAVKISHQARACDLTNLLRTTLHLDHHQGNGGHGAARDALVLVGTLRSVPPEYVRFEHEPEAFGDPESNNSGSLAEDFHVVRTLAPEDLCLGVLETMREHLGDRQRAMHHKTKQQREQARRRNVLSLRPTIAPQTRWYYVPDTSSLAVRAARNASSSRSSPPQAPTMASCLELDGYLTSLEDEDDEEESDSEEEIASHDNDESEAVYGDDEDLLRRALAPFATEDNIKETTADTTTDESFEEAPTQRATRRGNRATRSPEKGAREWRRYLQISRCHAAPDKPGSGNSNPSSSPSGPTLAGYMLKRSFRDPHVWRRHYCVLTLDDFWYVPRVVRPDEFLASDDDDDEDEHDGEAEEAGEELPFPTEARKIEIARSHGRISLARATLLGDSVRPSAPEHPSTRCDGLELVDGDGRIHSFRACSPRAVAAGAASRASVNSAQHWKRMLSVRITDALENAPTQHAELLVIEETVARNERWRTFLAGGSGCEAHPGGGEEGHGDGAPEVFSLRKKTHQPSILYNNNNNKNDVCAAAARDDHSSMLRSKVLRFGLDVAEYKEGCRQIQTLLWADTVGTTPSAANARATALATIRRLVRELWTEARGLLDRALELSRRASSGSATAAGGGSSALGRGLETLCQHVEYVITQKRRFPSRGSLQEASTSPAGGNSQKQHASTSDGSSDNNKNNNNNNNNSSSSKTRETAHYPHQRDPPPIDLFDLLWKELRTLG